MLKKLLAKHGSGGGEGPGSFTAPAGEDEGVGGEGFGAGEGQKRKSTKSRLMASDVLGTREYLVPKDKAAWLELLVSMVKKKIGIDYLSDKELRKVITRARPNLGGQRLITTFDKDAPSCLNWSVEDAAEWVARESGLPYLKEAFLVNQINGRRLVLVDASVLNQMGMRDLDEMRMVTAKIREILNIPAPNMMRALMRIPPFQRYLERKVRCTPQTEAMTFESFCKEEGFNYSVLRNNKNAKIPCTCAVKVLPLGVTDEGSESESDSEGEDNSLLNCPTVEYVVRNVAARDKAIQAIIQTMLDNVFLPNEERTWGKMLQDFSRILQYTCEEGDIACQERLQFAKDVALGLLEELERTAEILEDIDSLQAYIDKNIDESGLKYLRDCAQTFMESVVPIASIMAFGELDLETIFKEEPEFNTFVDEITGEAMNKVKEEVGVVVDQVIEEALKWIDDNYDNEANDDDILPL